MSAIKNGGPAFPRPASEYTVSGTLADGNDAIREQDGMSLRDYFAAKAMQGMLANSGVDAFRIAKEAYMFADAMLDRRERESQS